MGKIDEVTDGAAKLFTIGGNPNGTVILFLREWRVRMKHVFLLELAASLTLGFPAYGFYKIKNGNVDGFVDVAIKAAGVSHSE